MPASYRGEPLRGRGPGSRLSRLIRMIRRAEKPPNRLALMGKIAVRNLSFARERRKNHVHWAYPEDRGARGGPCAADQTPRFGTDRFGAGHFHQQRQTAVAGQSDSRTTASMAVRATSSVTLIAFCNRRRTMPSVPSETTNKPPSTASSPTPPPTSQMTHFMLLVQSKTSLRESSGLCTEADRTRAGPADNTQGQGQGYPVIGIAVTLVPGQQLRAVRAQFPGR